ncbi:hypothetical protein M3Y95_01239900 [Aphelenchoides besseyi]|nr:hypothetical protein M3Y95_01239900 [Aphelenchoides besseyi]
MFLFLFVFSIFFQIVSSYGNNDCIQKDKTDFGFEFKDCTGPTEVTMKWRKEHYLNWFYLGSHFNPLKTKLVINEQCTLDYKMEGNVFQWAEENGNENYSAAFFSSPHLYGNGILIKYWDDGIVCENKSLVNSIDDEWVWTRFRMIDFPYRYRFFVYVKDGGGDEGTEQMPLTTSTEIQFTTTESIEIGEVEYPIEEVEFTTTELVKNDMSIQIGEFGRLNLIVALIGASVGVFFVLTAISCSVALFMYFM